MPKARAPAKRWLEEKQGAIGGCQTVCLGCFWSGFLVGCFLSRDWLSFFFFSPFSYRLAFKSISSLFCGSLEPDRFSVFS